MFDNAAPRDWDIAGSYYNYALVGKELMFVVNPCGHSQQMNRQLKVENEPYVPVGLLRQYLD
ncbi:hypothetical protein SZ09_17440 [Vibrio parahaemolyticus]|nr:hypothetical protein SZ09_17440 [Vibrio parahaemolyticus]